jgi:hypothetical protein
MGVMYGVNPTWGAQTNAGRTHIATKGVVQSGLVLNLDAGVSTSYPGSGTVWTDLSGNGNTGTLTNGPTYSSANGGSIVFDGVDDYVDCGNSITNGFTNITVSVWYYAVSFASTSYFLTKYVGGVNGWFLYYSSSTNKFGVDGRESSAAYFSNETSNTYPINKWYNVVFTKSSTNWRLYVNSVLDVNNTNGNGSTSFNNNDSLDIGRYDASLMGKGNISQVSIYNRALTAAEITQNYNALKSRYI